MGFPPWSRGPLFHRGEKWQLSPLVEHGDSNPVFDITLFILRPACFPILPDSKSTTLNPSIPPAFGVRGEIPSNQSLGRPLPRLTLTFRQGTFFIYFLLRRAKAVSQSKKGWNDGRFRNSV